MPFHLSSNIPFSPLHKHAFLPFHKIKDSMYSRSLSILHTGLKKRHGLYVMKKRELEKMMKKERDEKRGVEQQKEDEHQR
jgi:hypothetical protein